MSGTDRDFRPIVFLLFVTFSSFVNTKEEKVSFPRPYKGGTPAGVRFNSLVS